MKGHCNEEYQIRSKLVELHTYLGGASRFPVASASEFTVDCFSRSSVVSLAMVDGGGGGRPTKLVMLRKSRQGAHFRGMAGLYNQLIVRLRWVGFVGDESQSTRSFVPRLPCCPEAVITHSRLRR